MTSLKAGLVLGLILLLAGCERSQSPTDAGPDLKASGQGSLSKFVLPSGATLTSATLHVYKYDGLSQQTNTVHRITRDWAEGSVTWAGFITPGNSYDLTPLAEFDWADGWHSIDITPVVKGWLSGSYPNYGVLLKRKDTYPSEVSNRHAFWSSESTDPSLRPYFELVYQQDNSTSTVKIVRTLQSGDVWDAYIWDGWTTPMGSSNTLYAGFANGKEKMSLIKFEIGGGICTRTQGYWKTHGPDPKGNNTNVWPVTSLKLGSVVYTDHQLLDILNQPVKGNGILILAHQLIAAKLNVAHGSDGTAAASAIDAADALIGSLVVPPVGTGRLKPDAIDDVAEILSAYNEGLIGPGHCE